MSEEYIKPMVSEGYSPVVTPEGVYTEAIYLRERNAMGEDYTDDIKAWVRANWHQFREGGDGHYRNDAEVDTWAEKCPLAASLCARILNGKKAASEACGIPDFQVDWIEMNAVGFLHGDKFGWHTDQFQSSLMHREETRALTFLYYFREEPARFTGGELEFFDGTLIEPENDLLLWIDPYQRHQVREVNCPESRQGHPLSARWSIAGWLHRPTTGVLPDWDQDPEHAAPIPSEDTGWGSYLDVRNEMSSQRTGRDSSFGADPC